MKVFREKRIESIYRLVQCWSNFVKQWGIYFIFRNDLFEGFCIELFWIWLNKKTSANSIIRKSPKLFYFG